MAMTSESPWAARLVLSTLLAAMLILAGCSRSSTPEGGETTAATSPEAPAAPSPGATATPAATKSGLLPLPELTPCASTKQPVLPAKWEATALMQDFFLNSVWYGKFVYDESAKAFRFSLVDKFGIDFDFLVTTDRKLYLLKGGDQPKSCELLTASSPFTVPSREWLDQGAVCVGQAPLLEKNQQWWKNPAGSVGANWFWYNTDNGLPFRSMYYADAEPSTPVPIYEHFTFNYFPSFKPVNSTNLGQLLQMCQSTARSATATQEFSRPSIEPLMKRKSGYPKTDARLVAQIQSWIPGVTECSSPSALPPNWPDQLQVTAFMTAVSFQPNPFPTRIYYDWKAKSQNTTLYYYPPTPKNYAQTAFLLGDTGYITNVAEGGVTTSCQQALPGPPVPDWKKVDGCECRAQIAPHTVLNPSDVPTKILWCPTDLQLKQVFWTWYSDTGKPVVFMQSNSSPTAGTGLNLADYHEWGPGSVAPAGTFDLPKACQGKPKIPNAFPKACNNCHLPLNSKGGTTKG
jgi:hypothetical protein